LLQWLRQLRFHVDHDITSRTGWRQPQGSNAPSLSKSSIHNSPQVTILKEGVHSGSSSGVVPSSFRIVRQLLSRIEDEESGK
jgi:hypothetical protein